MVTIWKRLKNGRETALERERVLVSARPGRSASVLPGGDNLFGRASNEGEHGC